MSSVSSSLTDDRDRPSLKSGPKFGALLEILTQKIEGGAWKIGEALPAERQLAAKYGVARSVVKQVIAELTERGLVKQAPNCRPTVARFEAVSLLNGPKRDQIAVWVSPDLQDFGASQMLEGIRKAIGVDDRHLIIGCPPSREAGDIRRSVKKFLQSLMDHPRVAGAILWAIGDPALADAYRQLSDTGIPAVYIDREPPERIKADVVASNQRRAAKTAAGHLIELGHRHIAIVSNDDRVSSVRDRVSGYREAIDDAGLPWQEGLSGEIRVGDQDQLRADSKRLIARLLSLEEPPTAILAVNDNIALYLCEAIRNAGLGVPGDISVVGFDWMMRWLPSGGELTTVAQPFEEIGRLAAQCLLERINSSVSPIHRHILLEAPLTIKGSTAPRNPKAGETTQAD